MEIDWKLLEINLESILRAVNYRSAALSDLKPSKSMRSQEFMSKILSFHVLIGS